MSTQNNNTVDPIQAAIDAQVLIQKDKNWKESELSQAKKARNKELSTIDNACSNMTKDLTDTIQIAQIRLAFDAKKLEVRAAHEPKIKALRIALEDITAGIGSVSGEKVGAAIAPVTKAVGGFWKSLKARA